ncbi:hypothetical protein ZIOFF_064746 [Zingiber officinale]|uniref:CCHC-type domain-containing protein n=1 Tax=Zingiber officinale TaxID=94328 RepID=A0A8J5EXJ0_ZINOF|nr:hypothetical protein ZIOFF_064746 [Zingiber officinale]
MAARRGKGGRGRGNMENLENDRDAKIQAFRRRVEKLTLCLEHQEARSERGSSHGYANDDSEHVNPFADRNFRNFVEKINRTAYVRVDIPEFHGHLQPEGFLDWLSAIKKIFEYKDIPDGKKVKLVATRLQLPRICVCLVESNTRDEITERKATIKDEVEMQQLWKLNDAYQLALKVESKLLRRGAKKFADVQSFYPSKESTSKGLSKKSGNKDGAYSTSKNKPISCFKCGQLGHYMNECPKRKSDTRAGFVEKEDEERPFEEDNPRYDDDEHDREEI